MYWLSLTNRTAIKTTNTTFTGLAIDDHQSFYITFRLFYCVFYIISPESTKESRKFQKFRIYSWIWCPPIWYFWYLVPAGEKHKTSSGSSENELSYLTQIWCVISRRMFSYDHPPNWVFLQRKENSLKDINLIFFSARRHRQHDSGLAEDVRLGWGPTNKTEINSAPRYWQKWSWRGNTGDSGDCLQSFVCNVQMLSICWFSIYQFLN